MIILSLLLRLIEICISALAVLTVASAVVAIVIYMVIVFILSAGASWTYSVFPANSKA